MNREELIARAYAYLSYLFREPGIKIRRIFLFGSVARGDFDKDSDLDLFIDVEKKDEAKIKKTAEHALNRFDEIEGEKWRLKGIKNKISLKTGPLEEWKLKKSIEKEGVVLYAIATGPSLKKYLLFVLRPIKPMKRRAKVLRKLFGRKEKGYLDKGLVDKYGGVAFTTRSFIISSEGLKEVTSFLSKEKAEFGFEEIWK